MAGVLTSLWFLINAFCALIWVFLGILSVVVLYGYWFAGDFKKTVTDNPKFKKFREWLAEARGLGRL